jgi:hypothetical protein
VSDRTLTRRLTSLFVALALIGAPALVLRAFCVGKSCRQSDASAASVPFCPLPADVRTAVAAGFRAGRSPDVMAATGAAPVVEPAALGGAPWPSAAAPDLRVPIAFIGPQVGRGALPDGTGLDQIAPTLAEALGFTRAHPEVRAGTSVGPLGTSSAVPPLVVEIAWAGVGSKDLGAAWPRRTAALIRDDGAATLNGTTGSLPVDPAATLTTIGTGGLPFQHGITGSRIRTDGGRVVAPWSDGAPESVISTLADDLRHADGPASRVGIVEGRATDRGLVGNGWYLGATPGDATLAPRDPAPAVVRLLRRGYGSDDGAPDVLGVVLRGRTDTLDARTAAIVWAVRHARPGTLIAIAGTGGAATVAPATTATEVARRVDAATGPQIVSGSTAGGLFLDTAALDRANLTSDAVAKAMRALDGPGGTPQFDQVYPSFAVSFARYC